MDWTGQTGQWQPDQWQKRRLLSAPEEAHGSENVPTQEWQPLTSSATMSADVLADEFQQMHQEAPGFSGFEENGETSTAALLAELQALQASMNMAGGSTREASYPPTGLGSTAGGSNHRGLSGNIVRSFSGENDDILGFALDSPFSLEDLFMSPTPASGSLNKNASGFPTLDVPLLASTPTVSQTPQLNRAVPSPLDLINRDFVSELYHPGAPGMHPPKPPRSGAFPPELHFAPLQNPLFAPPKDATALDEQHPPRYGRSASLGQGPTQPPPLPQGQKLFPSATFSGGGHARSPHTPDLPPPTPKSSETQRSKPPASSSQSSDTPPDNSRLVSAAEIMEALRKLPSRASHAAQREALRSSPPVLGGDLPTPPKSHRQNLLASSTCLEGVNAPPLFVQMSDEKLNSARNRALRGVYSAELEILRWWCLENLSEVVVENIPGVHFLSCNALPAAPYRAARLMLSKMTLWLRQFQFNVRKVSPVDLYMTIHEAARIFLDSDLTLLINIPSSEARTAFEKMYLVMEKMKKEACEQLRFSEVDLNPYKPDVDVKPRTLTQPLNNLDSGSGSGLSSEGSVGSGSGEVSFGRESGFGRGNKRKTPPEGPDGLRKRLGFTNQLGNKGSEQQRQWLKGLQHELTKLNEDEQVVAFDANPGGLAPVRRFVSEGALMAKYNLRMASWRLLAAASEKFDTLAKGALPSLDKYLGFAKYILGTCVGLTMAFCAIAGRETEAGKWEPKAEAVQSLLERTKKGMELAAELACIMTDLRTYEEDLLKLRVSAVGVMMREGGRSQQDAIVLLEQRAETILTALVAEVTSPPANNPVLWTCWQLIFDFSRAQIALHVVDDLDAKVKTFFGLA